MASKKLKFSSSSDTSNNNMEKQVANYQTRLASIGKEKDSRNALEKLLNLPEDQNVLFDIFDILNRPQQALFGAVNTFLEGGNFLEGAKEGITGETKTSGGDILRNLGVTDEEMFTLFNNPVSLSDALGFGLDIFGDPLDWGLWASTVATGGATAPVAISKTARDAAKAGGKTYKITKAADTAKDVAKGVDAVIDMSKLKNLTPIEMFVEKPIETTIKKSANEALMGLAKKGISKGGSVVDNLIQKGLRVIDDANVKAVLDAAEKSGKLISDLELPASLLKNYQAMKESARRVLDYSKALPNNLLSKIKGTDIGIELSKKESESLIKNFENTIRKYIDDGIEKGLYNFTKGDELYEQTFNELSKNIVDIMESEMKTDFPLTDILKRSASQNKKSIKVDLSKDSAQDIINYLGSIPDLKYKVANDNSFITISSKGKSKTTLNKILHNPDELEKMNKLIIKKDLGYTKDDLKYLNDLKKRLKKDREFKELYNLGKDTYVEVAKKISAGTDDTIDFTNIAQLPGYVRRHRTADVSNKAYGTLGKQLQGNASSFGMRSDEFGVPTIVANRRFQEQQKAIIKNKGDKIKKYRNLLYDTKKTNIETELQNIAKQKTDAIATMKTNLDKTQNSLNSVINKRKKIDKSLDDLSDLLSDDIIEKASNSTNEKIVQDMETSLSNISKTRKKVSNLMKELGESDIKKSRTKTILNNIDKYEKEISKSVKKVKVSVSKAKGAIDKQALNDMAKASKKVEEAIITTKKGMAKDATINKLKNSLNKINESAFDTLTALDKQQRKLEIDLGALKPENDAVILEKISQLENDIEFLKSEQGVQLFSNDYFQGIGDFVDATAKQSRALGHYRSTLLSSTLNNEGYINFIKKGTGTQVKTPYGFTRLSKDEGNMIVSKLESFKDVFVDEYEKDSNAIKLFKKQLKNSDGIFVDNAIYGLIVNDFKKEELNPFISMLNKFNNTFKKYSTLTPGFHLRNISGNSTNMWLSGVPLKDIPGLYSYSQKFTKPGYMNDLIDKAVEGVLSAEEKMDYDFLIEYLKSGFWKSGTGVQDLGEILEKTKLTLNDKNILKSSISKLTDLSLDANEFVDGINRMALFKYAKEHPKYLAKNGFRNAKEAVASVLFDPNNLSPFEQKYMKKIIPFYTFTKQNLVFQANNLMKNTSKYNRLMKTFKGAYDQVGEDSYYQYQKENFELPVATDEEGNLVTLKTNLPLSDLGEYMQNPLQRLVAGANPLIKAPFELTSGTNMYTGTSLNQNPLEYLVGMTGLQNLSTNQIKKIGQLYDFENMNWQDTTTQQRLAQLLPSLLRYTDQEKVQNYKLYQEIQAYQELVKQLKKQGIEVPSIRNLTSNSQSLLNKMEAYRKKRNSSN